MSGLDNGLGMRLLKKGQKGLVHAIFSRFGILLILLLIQFSVIFVMFFRFQEFLPQYTWLNTILSFVLMLYLINSQINPTAKLTWLVICMLAPIVGALVFLFTRNEMGHRLLKKRLSQIINETKTLISQKEEVLDSVKSKNPSLASLHHYLNRSGCFPVYENTEVKYYRSGEEMFDELTEQLSKAKEYIFLEYFIIDEGYMWGKVLEILTQKAKEGVEVRVMYDGTCEFALLPHDYPKRLQKHGIKCKAFAPVSPFVSTHYNYRDHRKILVVDGKVAFTGGINMADEYINRVKKHGYWKDTAIKLEGEAVNSFVLLFLQLWNVGEKDMIYMPYLNKERTLPNKQKGYVLPYGDWPLDDDKVGECVYTDMLNHAKNYVHIMSPYLILDSEMEYTLKYAAKRGIDVKIILPGIPDKKVPYALAKSHYKSLLDAGVKIYEFLPGFVHAKVFVADGDKAVVGTINLDYRSLYHHFECAALLYKVPCIKEIEEDFQETLTKCHLITKEDIKKEKVSYKIVGALMKVAEPLL